MFDEPFLRALQQELMKAGVWDGGLYLPDQASREAAFEEAEGEIDEITLAEDLDQRKPPISVGEHLVVPFDH